MHHFATITISDNQTLAASNIHRSTSLSGMICVEMLRHMKDADWSPCLFAFRISALGPSLVTMSGWVDYTDYCYRCGGTNYRGGPNAIGRVMPLGTECVVRVKILACHPDGHCLWVWTIHRVWFHELCWQRFLRGEGLDGELIMPLGGS